MFVLLAHLARGAQFLLILAKVGVRLEFRLLNQLLLEIYYRFVTHAIHKISTGRSYSRIASSRPRSYHCAQRDLYAEIMHRVRSRSRLDLD